MKKVAVITDATSSGYWFPKWHQYYGGHFGPEALHVVTYKGLRDGFAGFALGGLIEVPSAYSDDVRARFISALVGTLLVTHDLVVRCDVDEFLVPDPRKFSGLRDYIDAFSSTHVTAFGFNLFEMEGEPEFDWSRPILDGQRSHAFVSTGLHKTAVTTKPLAWSGGFHGCTALPAFGDLFLFHTKFADIGSRVAWFERMRSQSVEGSSEYQYFSWSEENFKSQQRVLGNRASSDGWEALTGERGRTRWLKTVTKNDRDWIWQGQFYDEDTRFTIPAEFRSQL